VATGILCDYTCGIVVIRAETLEQAKKIAIEKSSYDWQNDEICENLREMDENYIEVHGGG
jgi:hypothetical protein